MTTDLTALPGRAGAARDASDYTLREIDELARRVVRNNRHWWPAGDRQDQYAAAWEGIVETLCTAPASERELLEAGRSALARDVRDQLRHHGARRDSSNTGAAFARFWDWHGMPACSPEEKIVDRLAAGQIMASLTGRQHQAITALAATGDYWAAAQMLGIKPQTFRALLGRGRREFLQLWHQGEAPSRLWRCDRRVSRHETSDPAVLARRAREAAQARERRRSR